LLFCVATLGLLAVRARERAKGRHTWRSWPGWLGARALPAIPRHLLFRRWT